MSAESGSGRALARFAIRAGMDQADLLDVQMTVRTLQGLGLGFRV